MPQSDANDKTLQFMQGTKENNTLPLNIKSARFTMYKLLLVLLDFITINLGFFLATRFLWISVYYWNPNNILLFVMFSLIVQCFFPTFKLYSYHHIFYQKRHIKILIKAFCLSLITFCIVYFVYSFPINLEGKTAYFIIILASIAILFISRFLGDYLLEITRAFGISFIAIGIITLLSPDEVPLVITEWSVIPHGFFLAAILTVAARSVVVQYVFNMLLRRHFRRQIAVVGSDKDAEEIVTHIIAQNAPFYVQGIICGYGVEYLDSSVPKGRLGDLKELPKIAESTEINEIIVTDESMSQKSLIDLLDFCTTRGLTIWFPPKLLPIIDMKLYIDNFCGIPMIRLCSQKYAWLFNKIKHALDVLMGIPIFLLLVPVFIILGVIIKINSKGPVFYKARAIGKNGKEFAMFKFRSMRTDSSNENHKEFVTKMIKGEIDYEGKKDQVFKITDDPRVTSVGKFIRKYSIDELPQIINVLKGDMSLIGPRPCLPYELEAYEDWHKKRLAIRPGISGLWQVAGRSAVTFEDMIILDLYYLYNRSLPMDIGIIYETIYTILGKKGAH